MALGWQIEALIELIRLRYEGWADFDHPQFVAEEIAYKQKAVDQAAEWLNQTELDRLIAIEDFDTFLGRLEKLTKATNLLYLQQPRQGDTAVLHSANLDKPNFCTHFRNLLYADRPTSARLQTFSDYLAAQALPNKWAFATYFLFLCHPQTEMFVKPKTAVWFLKFSGQPLSVSGAPDAATYAAIRQQAHQLKEALQPYGVHDMVDVQSVIWIAFRETDARKGQLTPKDQIELDVPGKTTYQVTPRHAILAESDEEFEISAGEEIMVDDEQSQELNPPYPLAQCAQESGYAEADLARWVRAIQRKGQAVFYGPPGTGKTFLAQRLARHLVGGADGFVEMVQFHPAYAYEDFMQGIRPLPTTDGTLTYGMVHGRFYNFCQRASQHNGRCILIIDEINRANIAAVFGELMYLLEYRDQAIALAGGGQFSIPANVYLLATMNTADRSIALVDHALRRRFAFIHLPPNYDLLRHYHQQTGYDPTPLIHLLDRLNRQINDPHYQLGTSFFMQPQLADQLEDIWRMEVEPYLEEYFFDQTSQIEAFRWPQVAPSLGL